MKERNDFFMKTLIAYGTKHGTAEECAEILSKKLDGEVDVINLKKKTPENLSAYDKIIVGGSIYAGQIIGEVKSFCANNLTILKEKPLGLFLVCMSDDESYIETTITNSFSSELAGHAIARGSFGGAFHFSKMNFFEKGIIKMVTKQAVKEGKAASAPDGKTDISNISESRISGFANKINLM